MAIQKPPAASTADPLAFLDDSTPMDSSPMPTLDYTSPVLNGLDPQDAINTPPESVACRHCPGAIWMLFGKELQAYCQPLHVVIWSNEQRAAPSRCDAQIAALAQLQAKAKG